MGWPAWEDFLKGAVIVLCLPVLSWHYDRARVVSVHFLDAWKGRVKMGWLVFVLLWPQVVALAGGYLQEGEAQVSVDEAGDFPEHVPCFQFREGPPSCQEIQESEGKATVTTHSVDGTFQMTCEVAESDFASECRRKWRKEKEEEDRYQATVEAKFSWPSQKGGK